MLVTTTPSSSVELIISLLWLTATISGYGINAIGPCLVLWSLATISDYLLHTFRSSPFVSIFLDNYREVPSFMTAALQLMVPFFAHYVAYDLSVLAALSFICFLMDAYVYSTICRISRVLALIARQVCAFGVVYCMMTLKAGGVYIIFAIAYRTVIQVCAFSKSAPFKFLRSSTHQCICHLNSLTFKNIKTSIQYIVLSFCVSVAWFCIIYVTHESVNYILHTCFSTL